MTEIAVRLPALHAGQERRRALIVEGKKRFVVTMCGRQWGKSTDALEWLLDGALRGESVGLFAPTYKYLAPLWHEVVDRLRPLAGGREREGE